MKTSGETNEPFLKKTAQTDDQTQADKQTADGQSSLKDTLQTL